MLRFVTEKVFGSLTKSGEDTLGQLKAENRFLLSEVRRLDEMFRELFYCHPELTNRVREQTKGSFDYQWNDFNHGVHLASDPVFMNEVVSLISKITALPADWFKNKNVVDVGCGSGRFSYGMLKLGARVTSVDQSEWGVQRTRDLCAEYSATHKAEVKDLLTWSEDGQFDLAFSFGVVHHTGNTYLAMRNVANKVRPGGKLFLMIYGFPNTVTDFGEVVSYEEIRQELRGLTFPEKKKLLLERFGERAAHGWFDAVSPRINDLLTFSEIRDFLLNLGFTDVQRTIENRNHHLVATKKV